MDHTLHPAVFFDKDGTIVEDRPYNVDCSMLCLAAGAIDAMQSLQSLGYRLVVVTNQSGIARGIFTVEDFRRLERALIDRLATAGVRLAGVYFCPHLPNGAVADYAIQCDCRKPQPGLFLQAAEQLDLDLSRSWMIGDILDDIEAAHRAGCRAVLVDGRNETQWRWSPLRRPEATVANLPAAARYISTAPPIRRSPSCVSAEAAT
ncbi:MAG: HAD family hydrolase [Planctomycetaceae bacterium]|nr:HAD family hydrolase [Planctomycetaceae bacterium]